MDACYDRVSQQPFPAGIFGTDGAVQYLVRPYTSNTFFFSTIFRYKPTIDRGIVHRVAFPFSSKSGFGRGTKGRELFQ